MTKLTGQQRKALHLYFNWVAEAFNDAGLDMRAVLKPEVEIPWNKDTVKEYMWKPIMKLQVNRDSTNDMDTSEVDLVFDTFNRHLARHGIELSFPSAEKRSEFFEAMDMREELEKDYPVNDLGDVTF